MSDLGWMKDAVCAQFGPLDAVWFNEDAGEVGGNDPKVARRVCAACPVRAECLRAALEHDNRGMWAGTTRAERQRMVRAGKRPSRAA